MSLKPNAITTAAKVRAVLQKTDTADDSHIEDIINAVSAWVETYCNRIFLGAYSADITEYPRAYGKYITLRAYPILSITSIKDDTDTLSYTDEDTGDYKYARLKDDGMVERKNGTWSKGLKDIEVKYKGGYQAVANLPADLVYAVEKICAEVYRSEAMAGGIQSERIGDYAVSYTPEQAAHKSGVLGMLESFRNVQFL